MVSPKNKAIHLPSALVQAIGTVADLVGDIQYSVVSEYPAHLPAIEGDEDPLIQVIASLVASLIRTMQEKEVRVRAELVPASGELQSSETDHQWLQGLAIRGPWVVVSISNVTEGDPLKVVDIQEFDSGDRQKERNGMLDVMACQDIIGTFGGQFMLQQDEDQGSHLLMALPLKVSQRDGADVSSVRRVVESRLPDSEQATNTLLVMVEDPVMLDLLTSELTSAGYRTLSASGGADVMPLAREEKPDLILLDLLARDPTALDIALVLKHDQRTQNIPVLFVTMVSGPEGGVRMGAANFLVRQVGTGALLATVRAVLHSGLSPATRVLIAESDEVTRENMVMMIQAHGFRVTVATGPEEALALAERVDPGLILLNVRLAQERDYWLLRGLRQISEESSIVVLADALSEEEGKRAMSRGASGYGDTGNLSKILDEVRD
jgi:DNA-binding response OmpR family regulator